MRIAAISDSHDSSVCVINDGKIEFFCKEERVSGIKRDKNPWVSLKILKSLNLKIEEFLYCTPTNDTRDSFPYKKYLETNFHTKVTNYSFLQHHLCHASLAFFNSKFDECLVFVIDRNGSVFFDDQMQLAREAETVFVCNGVNSIEALYKNYWVNEKFIHSKNSIQKDIEQDIKQIYPNVDIRANSFLSIVKVYEAATSLIGQNVLENGKTMGLSSYGKKSVNQYFLDDHPLETKFIPLYENHLEYGQIFFNDYLDKTTKDINQNNYQFYADRALEVQEQTQEQTLNLIKKYVDKTKIKNVCLVGGYALNVVANGYFVDQLKDVNFYFEPIADDTGITIGACMLEYANQTGKKPDAIENLFFHYYDETEELKEGQLSNINEVCDLIIQGKSVAIFDGNPESGPRALGHRSILFDPRIKNGKEIVNTIKNREWYRPFAGVILEEKFNEYFHTMNLNSSSDMTINFYAKPGVKEFVPSIIHVDNSCRIQTVNNGFLYDLLKIFYDKTNCPMLLNTSFNLAGNPLVQTKDDAIKTLHQSNLDAVYFAKENRLILK